MSISPMKTPVSMRATSGEGSSRSFMLYEAPPPSHETPSAASSGLLPSVFTLTPPTTLARRRSDDSYQQMKRRRGYEDMTDDDEEYDTTRAGARSNCTPSRPALTLASPSSTNLASPVSKRPRYGRSISMGSVLQYHGDTQHVQSQAPGLPTLSPVGSSPPFHGQDLAKGPVQEKQQEKAAQEKSVRDTPAYEAYLARQRRDSSDDGNHVWSEEVEEAFMQAIRMIPKVGRRKITVHGRPCGRNELISDYIFRKTGKTRTRKQVSSHIQVLKHLLKDDAEFMELVSDSPRNAKDASPPPAVLPEPISELEKSKSELQFLPSSEITPNPVVRSNSVHTERSLSFKNTDVTIMQQKQQDHQLSQKEHQPQEHQQRHELPPQHITFQAPILVSHSSSFTSPSSGSEILSAASPLDDSPATQELLYDERVYLSPTGPEQIVGAPLTDVNGLMYMHQNYMNQSSIPRGTITTYIANTAQHDQPLGIWVECDPIAEHESGSLYSPHDLLEIWQ